MNKEDVQQLYRYNKWATDTVLNSLTPLTPEEFTRHLGGSFPSVRDTLVHIVGAEWIWLRRWKGISPPAWFTPSEFSSLDSVKAKVLEVRAEQLEFVGRLTDESLKETVRYVNLKQQTWEYPLGRLMQHVVNHSTYHRGQVANFLRQLGSQPAATDFLIYFDVESKGYA